MNLDSWSVLISVILPALISIIVKPEWSNSAKVLTAFALSFALAAVQVLVSGNFNVADMGKTLSEVFVLVMGSYAIFWRPSGVAQKIEENINR